MRLDYVLKRKEMGHHFWFNSEQQYQQGLYDHFPRLRNFISVSYIYFYISNFDIKNLTKQHSQLAIANTV